MKYGSTFSGIEAASVAWESLGWKPVFFSEIEPFPCAVLKHRFPDVPNFGDITKIHELKEFQDATIDVLVGGSPCQSFSQAGLRKGLEDPRGNLMLTFLSVVDKKRPSWVVWENVPGVLSSNNGKDFTLFLDCLEEIGYISDVDILDAVYFGVPQRRRRVFVCAQSREDLLRTRTTTSGLTICQFLVEILHGIFQEVFNKSEKERKSYESTVHSRDGVLRRMSLLGITTVECSLEILQSHLVEVFLKHHPEPRQLELSGGSQSQKCGTLEDLLMGSSMGNQFTLTEESLRSILEDVYEVMKLYITSTSISSTIESKIFTFLKADMLIGRLTCHLSGSSPTSWSAGLSFLMFHQTATSYARQASTDIFRQLQGVYSWNDFLREAEHSLFVVAYLGDWRPAAAVLFESYCLSGDTKKGRKKREEPSAEVESCADCTSEDVVGALDTECGYNKAAFQSVMSGHIIPVSSPVVIDRAAYNQGENALYDPQIKETETMPPLLASGPHVVFQSNEYASGNSFDSLASNSMKSKNPDSGCRKVESSKTLDTSSPDPNKNQGGIAILHPEKQGGRIDGLVDSNDQSINATEERINALMSCGNGQVGNGAVCYGIDEECNARVDQMGPLLRGGEGGTRQCVAYPIHDQATRFNGKRGDKQDGKGNGLGIGNPDDPSPTLTKAHSHAVFSESRMAVRRLTPIETERLQGFPDNWTKIPWRGKSGEECPDGPRYKACGNSMAVPVMKWIAERIEYVEGLMKETGDGKI